MFILLPIAFISGILTAFSPCVLPILPIVLASGVEGKVARMRGIIIGIVVSFTLAALFLATIVKALGISADSIRNIAVVFLVAFGLSMIFPVIWGKIQVFIERFWQFKPAQSKNGGFIGGFFTGVSLGVVWLPCIGPIVATVATLAAVNELSIGAAGIVFSYALGAGVALYFIAKGGKAVSARLGFVKANTQTIRQVFGVVVFGTALFIFSGSDRKFQEWILTNLPESWTQIATNFEKRFNAGESLKGLKGESNDLKKGEPGSVVIRDVSLQNDFNGAKVSSSDLLQGCLGGKDCIPSIDNPKFDSARVASWLRDDDVVFAVDYKDVKRAYPQRILNWHEIVNDTLRLRSGQAIPIAVTFCPLCGSALAFERKVDGVITEFGVSGKLHNSDLVMYDRYEGNLWQQITGEGIVGPAARRNEALKQIPIVTTTFGKWKKEHPDTEVLSQDTGFPRNYDIYPYGTYEQDDELYFGVKNLNKKLQIKTIVYGIEVGESSKAYPESAFDKNPAIEDLVGGISIRLEQTAEGQIKVTNLETNEEIIPIRIFWFAWASFHPDTELYSQ